MFGHVLLRGYFPTFIGYISLICVFFLRGNEIHVPSGKRFGQLRWTDERKRYDKIR